MDDFSSQLGKIKCSVKRYFSMKFPSEGEFWNCHFAGYKMGASNQMFQAKLESENKKISKVRHSVPTTVGKCHLTFIKEYQVISKVVLRCN